LFELVIVAVSALSAAITLTSCRPAFLVVDAAQRERGTGDGVDDQGADAGLGTVGADRFEAVVHGDLIAAGWVTV
jgi:hypothetical protein